MEFIQHILDFLGGHSQAIIAISALALAIWQGVVQRKHYRLSVKPHLVFHRLIQNDTPQIEITLSNSGIGPAVISKFSISFDGKEVDFSPQLIWNEIRKKIEINTVSGGGWIYFAGEALNAGGKIIIFTMNTTKDETDLNFSVDNAHKELERLQIEVKYKSIYGDEFTEHFKRS